MSNCRRLGKIQREVGVGVGEGAHLQGFWLGGLGAWPEDQHLAGLQDFT